MVFSKIRQLSVPVPRPSSGVPLAKEDVEILSEFLNFEDMAEFDADPLLPSRDAATNIIPQKDQVFRLQEIVARQEQYGGHHGASAPPGREARRPLLS